MQRLALCYLHGTEQFWSMFASILLGPMQVSLGKGEDCNVSTLVWWLLYRSDHTLIGLHITIHPILLQLQPGMIRTGSGMHI